MDMVLTNTKYIIGGSYGGKVLLCVARKRVGCRSVTVYVLQCKTCDKVTQSQSMCTVIRRGGACNSCHHREKMKKLYACVEPIAFSDENQSNPHMVL